MAEPTLRAGDAVGHYRIAGLLGAGGMGEVYVAEDERLRRKVALKLLPPSVANDAARVRRFEQEARTASALSHPNIVTVFDLGQAGSRTFITTELVEGRTLREEMRARGRIPADEAMQIARQCAAGLMAAHGAGIVHRDIKPENIMVRPDRLVKLLDFGLAKVDPATAADEDTVTNLTSIGTVVGTIGYLSPEQARGQPVDARTDIFSLAVVLYEMVAGVRPFRGESDNDTIAAILREPPAPLTTYTPGVPAALQAFLDKALAKDRADRYASMAEFADDLERRWTEPTTRVSVPPRRFPRRVVASAAVVAAGAALSWFLWPFAAFNRESPPPADVTRVRTLAVLPFTLIGGADAETEHLGLGLADALIVKLTNQRQVTVRPTNAVMRYAEGDPDAGEAGRALQVDAVLIGTVQRAGDRVRVRAQLIRTPAAGAVAETIWNDEFPESAADLLDLQDRLAAAVVDRLAIQLSSDERQRLTRRETTNAQAYQLYLEGRYFLNKRSEDGYRRAIALFEQAASLDPQFARPHVNIAVCWNGLIEIGGEPPAQVARARDALARALALDETLGEAHAYQSLMLRLVDWRFADAQRESDRSIELEPNHPMVLQWRGVHLLASGRGEDAVAAHRRAWEIDPLDHAVRSQLARAYYFTRRFDEAIATGRALLQLDEAQSPAHQWVGTSLAAIGRHVDAQRHLERALELSPKSVERQATLAHAYAAGGRAADARRMLQRLSGMETVDHYSVATIHVGLGEPDAAFRSLELARQTRNVYFANRLALDPKLDPLRGDARFMPLLRELGLN